LGYQLFPVGRRPVSLAFAAGVDWVTDVGSDVLFGLDAITGDVVRKIETGRSPYGVFTDGETVWVANTASDTVTQVDARDFSHREFRVPASPTDLVTRDGTVWVLSQQRHTLTAIDERSSEATRKVELGGSPLKLEIHDSSVVITNPGLGQIQRVPL